MLIEVFVTEMVILHKYMTVLCLFVIIYFYYYYLRPIRFS